MENENVFKTKDFNLAACLMVDGVLYLGVEKDIENNRRLVFMFDKENKEEEIDRIKSQRVNGTHIVSSTAYDDALRKLKSVIHSF